MNEPELVLLDSIDAKKKVCSIWPGQCVCEPGAIEENKTYIFELRNPPDPLKAHLFIDDQKLKRDILDSPLRVQWEWNVEFHAGEIEVAIQLEHPQITVRKVLITDPDRRKLTREQFDTMIRQILDDTFALLSFSSYKFHISRGNAAHFPPIARLEFIKSRVERLDVIIRAIDNNPIRVLRATMDIVPFHKATHLRPQELLKSFTVGKIIQGTGAQEHLPKILNGRVPEKIYKARKSLGLDIREHRDIKSAIKLWSAWLLLIADLLSGGRMEDKELAFQRRKWSLRCQNMSRKLDLLLKLPLFEEVQDVRQPIYATQIYQRVPAYGQFLAIYNDFQRGITNIIGEFLQVPLARTYDLYEVWTFLRLARAASIMFPNSAFRSDALFDVDKQAIVVSPKQVCFDFGRHLKLCFQRTYKEFWLDQAEQGSYSRSMRPDFVLEILVKDESTGEDKQKILVVLDAKYRVEGGLNEALSSIHMYRDALVYRPDKATNVIKRIVAGAYLVTPDFYAINGEWRNLGMPARLFHPDYRSYFCFGAFTMRPGMSDEEVIALLNVLITDCSKN